jgi:hypothetical protein
MTNELKSWSLLMGVLFDYFRAANAETAVRAMDRMAGPLIGTDAFDGVETKIDPRVQLGKLVAFIRQFPGISMHSRRSMCGLHPRLSQRSDGSKN